MATNGPFFRRAVPPDRTAFLAEIERRRAALAEARAAGDGAAVRDAAGGLGSMLFWIEGSEGEAARTAFEKALAIRKTLGDPRFLGSTQAALDDIAKMA